MYQISVARPARSPAGGYLINPELRGAHQGVGSVLLRGVEPQAVQRRRGDDVTLPRVLEHTHVEAQRIGMSGTPRSRLGRVISHPFEPRIDVGSCCPSGNKRGGSSPPGRIEGKGICGDGRRRGREACQRHQREQPVASAWPRAVVGRTAAEQRHAGDRDQDEEVPRESELPHQGLRERAAGRQEQHKAGHAVERQPRVDEVPDDENQ